MKYILILGDGMADYPIAELGDKTPLQVANKPNMDLIAAKGQNGLLKTVPDSMNPGSGPAILSVLGYDPQVYYSGRGPLEAAGRNIHLNKQDVAFRCNLITEKDGKLIDYAADHISSKEASQLIEEIKEKTPRPDNIEFFVGLDYRHFLVIRDYLPKEIVDCTLPHNAIGEKVSDILPKAESEKAKNVEKELKEMILGSKAILENHPVNLARAKVGKNPGNMIWPWGGGRVPVLPTFKERFGVSSAVISAVDLVKGIGRYAGMKVVEVPGVTGLFDTNYEGKADYALEALNDYDLVFVHVEAPDEAGHAKDYELKIKTIEDLDKRLIGRIMDNIDQDVALAVLPDHPTPIKIGTHTRDPVPFAIYNPTNPPDNIKQFDEQNAKNGKYGTIEGPTFMTKFLNK
ncbi:MAG: cofactor-independent phosphoglycerate mutase [Candidatus Bathyarchaeota archaeon]|nr:MAG: cofactor-independent phosphoglycerate mutase [Candidatus Bathyarchaeota archaeon]